MRNAAGKPHLTLFFPRASRSFFGNLLGLYSGMLAQAGYGDKWPS
jgi:hypothetical protein